LRASYRAYVDKDRDAIEALIAPDFHFTSPLDNRLDRDAYLARCWPNSALLAGFRFVDVAVHGEYVFVVYEADDERQALPERGAITRARWSDRGG
jgi:hypothetical protein